MKLHDKKTRYLFNKIHLKQKDTTGYKRIVNLLSEKILGLPKNYFKGKVCADLGCGSTGAGALNLLNMGAKEVHLMDMHKHIFKPLKENLKKYKGKFNLHVGNLKNVPFKDNFFDFVLCQGVIHHMDSKLNAKKSFKEIHRILKPGGKSYINVIGQDGIIPDILFKVIRQSYKKDKNVKKIINDIFNKNTSKYENFLNKNLNPNGLKLFNILKTFFDDDFLLTSEDRIKSPTYLQYYEKELKISLNDIGLKKMYRIKKKVKYNNIRDLVAPMYEHYEHKLSRALYGEGSISVVATKGKK